MAPLSFSGNEYLSKIENPFGELKCRCFSLIKNGSLFEIFDSISKNKSDFSFSEKYVDYFIKENRIWLQKSPGAVTYIPYKTGGVFFLCYILSYGRSIYPIKRTDFTSYEREEYNQIGGVRIVLNVV